MVRKLVIASIVFMGVWFYFDLQGKVLGGRMMILDSAAEKNLLTIRKSMDQGAVHGIQLYFFGHMDGTAAVSLSDEKQMIRSYRIGPGRISLKAGGDWYADKCLITYEPSGVQSGNLALRYRFKTSEKTKTESE